MKNNYFLKYVFLLLFVTTSSTIFGQTETVKDNLVTKEKGAIEKTILLTKSQEVKPVTFSSKIEKKKKIAIIQKGINLRLSKGLSKLQLKRCYEQLEKFKNAKIVNTTENEK